MTLLLTILLIHGLKLSAWWYLVAGIVYIIQSILLIRGASTQLGALSYLMEQKDDQYADELPDNIEPEMPPVSPTEAVK